jgi:hypothetical protein
MSRLSVPPLPFDLCELPCVRATLALLAGRFRCAEFLRRLAWDFPAGLEELRATGIPDGLLATLVTGGHVEARGGDGEAVGQQLAEGRPPEWRPGTCFVLTPEGAALALPLLAPAAQGPAPAPAAEGPADGSPADLERPRYDTLEHQLWFRGQVVRTFGRRDSYQEVLVAATEEEGWPRRGWVDDPLPGGGGPAPEDRLEQTIKSLNRALRCRGCGLRFRPDRDRRRFCWFVCREAADRTRFAPGSPLHPHLTLAPQEQAG